MLLAFVVDDMNIYMKFTYLQYNIQESSDRISINFFLIEGLMMADKF